MTFDLQSARKHADTGGLMNTTKWLHAALDEIERLQDREQQLKLDCGRLWQSKMLLSARIKELEVWLVEERATGNYYSANPSPMWDGLSNGHKNIWRLEACQQLQAEGKIGGGNHIVGANQMGLTAAQRDALEAITDLKTGIICPECGARMGCEEIKPHVRVLRAMLEEAKRE